MNSVTAMRTFRKYVHTLSVENVLESSIILCGGKLQTLKFTYQQTEYTMFTQTGRLFFLFLLQLKHQVSMC